jgi:hypothetical protein
MEKKQLVANIYATLMASDSYNEGVALGKAIYLASYFINNFDEADKKQSGYDKKNKNNRSDD